MNNNNDAQKLARRYVRLVYWSEEDKAYVGSLPEICGPCCDAATPQEVYELLDEIALGYAEDKLAGKDYGAVPDPGNLTFITNTRQNESANSGSRVAQIRKRLNVSQAVFAEIMQVNRSSVQKWEDGTRKPSGTASRLLELVSEHPELVMRRA